MQSPNRGTPVPKCLSLALYAHTLLTEYSDSEALKALGATLDEGRVALEAAQAAYRASLAALLVARARVKLADYRGDQAVRATALAVEAADGRKNGRIGSAVFAGGVTPIATPAPPRQPPGTFEGNARSVAALVARCALRLRERCRHDQYRSITAAAPLQATSAWTLAPCASPYGRRAYPIKSSAAR